MSRTKSTFTPAAGGGAAASSLSLSSGPAEASGASRQRPATERPRRDDRDEGRVIGRSPQRSRGRGLGNRRGNGQAGRAGHLQSIIPPFGMSNRFPARLDAAGGRVEGR